MAWIVCFKIPPSNVKICIPIPVLLEKTIPPKWITGLNDSIVKDLPVLATIDELAGSLSSASLRRSIQSAAQQGVKQPDLKDVTIEFGKRG